MPRHTITEAAAEYARLLAVNPEAAERFAMACAEAEAAEDNAFRDEADRAAMEAACFPR